MSAVHFSIAEADVLAELAAAEEVALGFDYDGTLTPIVERPDRARAPSEVAKQIAQLARRRENLIAIVTGRSILDLDTVFDVPEVWVLGRHGLQWSAPGGRPRPPPDIDVEEAKTKIRGMKEELQPLIRQQPALFLEDKEYALTLHTRRLDPSIEPVAHRAFREAIPQGFSVIVGKKVIEARPDGHDKGTAFTRLIEERMPRALAFYVGDDTTDEDVFRALPEGSITIRVLDDPKLREETAARFWLEAVEEVHQLLSSLVRLRS
ncbi:MAG: trehalose-phosphatase [Myxococcota bacterium]